MPKKPKSICSHASCHKKVHGTYCDAHQKERKSYGYSSKMDSWYNKSAWRGSNPNAPLGQRGGLREKKLLETPYCEHCKEKGIYKDVTGSNAGVVDHKTPFRSVPKEQQWDYFTDWDNLQVLCRSCDASKTAKDRHNS